MFAEPRLCEGITTTRKHERVCWFSNSGSTDAATAANRCNRTKDSKVHTASKGPPHQRSKKMLQNKPKSDKEESCSSKHQQTAKPPKSQTKGNNREYRDVLHITTANKKLHSKHYPASVPSLLKVYLGRRSSLLLLEAAASVPRASATAAPCLATPALRAAEQKARGRSLEHRRRTAGSPRSR